MNRIPDTENAHDWALEMYRLGLAFHIDDDPADIVDDQGQPMFNEEEIRDLRVVIENFSDAEAEEYFETVLDEHRKQEAYFKIQTEDYTPQPDSAAFLKPSKA